MLFGLAVKNVVRKGQGDKMPQKSDFDFRQTASLSQQLADKDSIYSKLVGSDPEISKQIGVLSVLCKNKVIKKSKTINLVLDILDVMRKAAFATSEKTDVVTKLGLQMPRRNVVYDGDKDR